MPEPGPDRASIGQQLRLAAAVLARSSETARLDAELLLMRVLEQPRSYLYSWPEQPLGSQQLASFNELLARRLAGEPVAYLTGWREFRSLPLEVTPATLIPRPETELLVSLALDRLPLDRVADVADLGTGSGAIALAIAQQRPRALVVASELSNAALAVARRNAERLGLSRVEFVQGSWCDALPDRPFDLIVSNPPYIAAGDPCLRDLRFEPSLALIAADAGLGALQAIIDRAPAHLGIGGWLLLEHGHDQAAAVGELLAAAGFDQCMVHRDLAGHDRVSLGRMLSRPAPSAARPGIPGSADR